MTSNAWKTSVVRSTSRHRFSLKVPDVSVEWVEAMHFQFGTQTDVASTRHDELSHKGYVTPLYFHKQVAKSGKTWKRYKTETVTMEY